MTGRPENDSNRPVTSSGPLPAGTPAPDFTLPSGPDTELRLADLRGRPTDSLEFELDAGDHRMVEPEEVWAVEEQDGFLSAVEVVHLDGTREVVSVKRVGLRRLE